MQYISHKNSQGGEKIDKSGGRNILFRQNGVTAMQNIFHENNQSGEKVDKSGSRQNGLQRYNTYVMKTVRVVRR